MSGRSFVVLASASMMAACGLAPSTTASGARGTSSSSISSPVPDSPIPTASGQVAYVNRAGQFTFAAPADWHIQSCEDLGGYAVSTHSGPPPCGRLEYNDAWFIVESPSGDQRQALPPNRGSSFYTGTLTGTTEVTVDGVRGNRYTATVDKDLPLPPPKGTTQIYYVFFNGYRTYAFVYDHFPADPDRSADFDGLVQRTVRFSA